MAYEPEFVLITSKCQTLGSTVLNFEIADAFRWVLAKPKHKVGLHHLVSHP